MAGADDEEDAVASQVFIPWRQQSGEGIHVWSIPNEQSVWITAEFMGVLLKSADEKKGMQRFYVTWLTWLEVLCMCCRSSCTWEPATP